eukprot:2892682-Amphidinium_carterae.1
MIIVRTAWGRRFLWKNPSANHCTSHHQAQRRLNPPRQIASRVAGSYSWASPSRKALVATAQFSGARPLTR